MLFVSFVLSLNTFSDETSLPPYKAFYSKLSGTNITKDGYEHAQRVWNTFSCNIMGDYHDVFLVCDVLLLCDIFERFRNKGMSSF